MTQIQKTEGIVLKVIDFKEYDQIMTVLTKERGLVKWIFKKRTSSKAKNQTKIPPLLQAEFQYIETKNELWKCQDYDPSNFFFKLRDSYQKLQCAGRLIQWILQSQPLHRPNTKMYYQFLVYLEKILVVDHLEALEMSFLTLILRNEGLLNDERCCSVCQNLIQTLHIHQGEHYCAQHAPNPCLIFNEEETFTWYEILQSRTFSHLFGMEIPKNLFPKVETLFQSLIC